MTDLAKTAAAALPAGASDSDIAKLAAAIGLAIGGAMKDIAPRKFIPFGQHDARTVFNPTGKRNRTLKYKSYQNGFPEKEDTLYDEEIELLDKLEQGNYIDNLVTVLKTEDFDGGTININYKCKTPDQRMAIGSRITGEPGSKSGFHSMLIKIVREQEARKAALKAQRKRDVEDALNDV